MWRLFRSIYFCNLISKKHLRKHMKRFDTSQYYSVFLLFEKHSVEKTLVVRSEYFRNAKSKYKVLKGDQI
jgi:hypothetical protein